MKKIQSINRFLYFAGFLLLGLGFLPFSYTQKIRTETVYCLVDISRSITPDNLKREREIIHRFQTQAKKENRSFEILTFAESPSRVQKHFSPDRTSNGEKTNPESALLAVANLSHYNSSTEILLISDGGENEGNLLHAARQVQIPISVIPLPIPSEPDISITQLNAPDFVRQYEPFVVKATVSSNRETKARLTLFENDVPIEMKEVTLSPGETEFSFKRRSETIRTSLLKVSLDSVIDAQLENNALSATVNVWPPTRILIVTLNSSEISIFIERLKRYGHAISIIRPEEFPDVTDSLQNTDIVFLADIPATSLSSNQTFVLEDYVRNRGGALFVTGGVHSFSAGQYSDSDLETILPVRSDYTPDQNSGEIAICFLIDRSGSMKGEKIRYAKSALTEALELLSGKDRMAIIAFDQSPDLILPLQYAIITPFVRQKIEQVSASGGTNITAAISQAIDILKTTPIENKHIVLLSDGVSSPTDDTALFKILRREKISLSIVLSNESSGEDVFRRLAENSGGIFYRSFDAESIPRLIVNETGRFRCSAFEETESVPKIAAKDELTTVLPSTLPALKGYVRTEAKNESEIIIEMPDRRPLLANWRLGLGSVYVWTSDITPRWSSDWLSADETFAFWSELIRHSERARPRSNATIITYPPEFITPFKGTDFLKRVSEITGGQFNPEPEQFFEHSPQNSVRRSTRRLLFFGSFMIFLASSLTDRLFPRKNEIQNEP